MAGKRGHGEGTIYKDASGRWHGQLTLPNHKRKNVYGKTRRDVQEKLAQLRREVDVGMHSTTGGEQTLRKFGGDWLAHHQHRIRSKTYSNYESIYRLHLDGIGDTVLNKLKPADIQAHYGRKLKVLSPTSVQHIHAFIHVVLESAMRLGVISRNYSDFVDAPGLKPTEIQPLSEEQARAMLGAVRGDKYEAAYVLALATGMREGELLGLRWEDIDWKRGRVRVALTIRRLNRKWLFEPPKSRSSLRTLPLADYAAAALQRRREIQEKDREYMGDAWEDTKGLIFTREVGDPVPFHGLLDRFRRLVKPAGIPASTRIHDLRHTFATLLIERGVPIRVVSELLGHSSIAITLQIYGHVTPRMREGAFKEITDLLRFDEPIIDATIEKEGA